MPSWIIIVMLVQFQCYASFVKSAQVLVDGRAPMTRLVEDLFDDGHYIKDILPNCLNHNKTPIVIVDMAIRSILDVDEPRQIVSANVWLRWIWDDCRLSWNKTEYDGIDHILVAAKRLWIPDIELYDSGDTGTGTGFQNIANQRIRLFNNGTLQLLCPTIIKFTCKMNVAYFPFDYQVCRLKFASWSYTGHELDVVNVSNEADMSLFVDNGEWNIVRVPVLRRELYYPCCKAPFPEVTFFFIMRREVLFYMFNLVMPCMMITNVGMLVFWLPPDSGEKVSLGVTILLSLVVFLLIVSDKLPSTSDTVPMIAYYFASTMVLISVSCAVVVLVWNLHNMDPHGIEVPRWLRKCAQMCSKICCIKYKLPPHIQERENEEEAMLKKKSKKEKPNMHYSLIEGLKTGHNVLSAFNSWDPSKASSLYDHNMDKPKSCNNINYLESITKILERLERKSTEDEMHSDVVDEWKCISLIMDRVFFIIIFSINVLLTLTLFLNGYFRSIDIPEPEY